MLVFLQKLLSASVAFRARSPNVYFQSERDAMERALGKLPNQAYWLHEGLGCSLLSSPSLCFKAVELLLQEVFKGTGV